MSKIPLGVFMVLWNEIRDREHKTDFGLAHAVGLSNGTVSQWKAGKVKAVLPDVLNLIEKHLGYKIRLTKANDWEITKIGEVPQSTESENERRRWAETGESEKICQLFELHGIDTLDKARRYLRRKDELEALYLRFENISREAKLKAEDE